MLVIDASVLVVALVDDGEDGMTARERLRGQALVAPELIDLEILSVLRRHVTAGLIAAHRGEEAVVDLLDLPLRRASHRHLVRRCWELRHNLTTYGASYVALAEALDTTLLTADSRLAGAPGLRCQIELIPPGGS